MANFIKKALFSNLVLKSKKTQVLAYVGVLTAFSVVTQTFLEFSMYDIQFSLTIFVSIFIGILLGGAFGFTACFLGDLIGYLLNSFGGLYMPWVGISTGLMAFIAGFIFNGFKNRNKGSVYVKLGVITVLTFVLCTIAVNSTGFYFYNKEMGFSTAVVNYVSDKFGGNVSYLSYCAYRLIFKGQIFNSLLNYVLLFIFLPLIMEIKFIKRYN